MAEVEGCARVRGRCRQELQSILALMFHCSMFRYKAVLVISTFFDVDVDVDVCCKGAFNSNLSVRKAGMFGKINILGCFVSPLFKQEGVARALARLLPFLRELV